MPSDFKKDEILSDTLINNKNKNITIISYETAISIMYQKY